MILKILGSGGALPSKKRSAPAFLLKIKDDLILIDAGFGTLAQFEKIDEDYFDITHILITHYHADHLTDLAAIIQSIYVRTLTFKNPKKREKPLIVFGPPGFKKIYKQLTDIMTSEDKPFKIEIFEMGNSTKKLNNWILESKIVRHSDRLKSLSFKINEADDSILFSGDTSFCPEIIDFAKKLKKSGFRMYISNKCRISKRSFKPAVCW